MIVVCKKFRLVDQSANKFKINEMRKEVRSAVKLDNDYVLSQNAIAETTGVYYEIDEKLTADRNSKLSPVSAPTEKELLQQKAESLGIQFDKRMGVDKLNELISEQE